MKKFISPSNIKIFFIIIIITTITSFGLAWLRKQFGLPDNPTEADHLTTTQILLGFILTILNLISTIVGIVSKICFTLALIVYIAKLLQGSKSHPKSK